MPTETALPHVALLRNINVAKNTLPMPELAKIFVEAGAVDPKTYIQTGNVVFLAAPSKVAAMPEFVTKAIADRYGFQAPVVIRSLAEMEATVANNPFPEECADPTKVHVMFLGDAPSQAQVDKLDPRRSPQDTFVVKGKDMYVHTPKGAGESKLTNVYIEKQLGTKATGRNWRTVNKLLEMARAKAEG